MGAGEGAGAGSTLDGDNDDNATVGDKQGADTATTTTRTYTDHWVPAVVIAAHADGRYDVFLPSSVDIRYVCTGCGLCALRVGRFRRWVDEWIDGWIDG